MRGSRRGKGSVEMTQQKDMASILERLFFGRINPYEDYHALPEARSYHEQAGKLEEEFL